MKKNVEPLIAKVKKTAKPGTYTYRMRLLVNTDGTIIDAMAENDPLGIGKELEDIMRKSPRWNPGEIKKKKVTTYHTQPITIYISGIEGNVGSSNGIQLKSDSIVFTGNVQNALIMVDGKEYKGKLEGISPESIESISVLKDAVAIAKYGEKGKNGVIEIKTKDGKLLRNVIVRNPAELNEVIVQGKPLSKADTFPDRGAVFEKLEQPPYVNMQQWRQHLSKQLGAQ